MSEEIVGKEYRQKHGASEGMVAKAIKLVADKLTMKTKEGFQYLLSVSNLVKHYVPVVGSFPEELIAKAEVTVGYDVGKVMANAPSGVSAGKVFEKNKDDGSVLNRGKKASEDVANISKKSLTKK